MNKQKGFTLIELLVVIAIVAILSVIVVASLTSAREKGRVASGVQFSSSLWRTMGASAVGYWNFDEGSGSEFVDQLMIHNGIGGGSPLPTWTTDTPNNTGYAINFASAGGYIATAGTIPTPSANITISAWVKSSNTAQQTIVSNRGGSTGGATFFGINNTKKLYVYINNSSVQTMLSVKNVADGKWHHVAWTGDGTKSTMYIDGQVDSVLTRTNFALPAAPIQIGRDSINAGTYVGSMDEVGIFGRTLTASEINDMYLAGLTSKQEVLSIK